jgi:hypothetical protein
MERMNVAEPNDLSERISQLRARLTPDGKQFFEEFERRSDAVRRGEATDIDHMEDSVWLRDRLPTLSVHDREIVVRAMQLHALQVFGSSSGEETIEELVDQAHEDPEDASRLIAMAQEFQVYVGEPLQPDMDVREAADVLRRLLFDSDL